jgi:hypothetical protein
MIPIGWKEWIDFPDWGVQRVRAKVDTGARTTAIDVTEFELRDAAEGQIARFRLALRRKRLGGWLEAPVLRMTKVRNTGGIFQERPVVETTMRIGTVTRRIRLTLTDRSRMHYAVILGRSALEGTFLIDVSRKYLLGR